MFNTDNILMDKEKIKSLLPHREPFLLLDAVHEFESGVRIVASRQLTSNEPVFTGHFPGNPIYPGVYYVESIAQAGALLIFESGLRSKSELGVLTTVEGARFRRACRPGDQICYEVTLEKMRGPFTWVKGKAFVGNELVAEAQVSVAITKKE